VTTTPATAPAATSGPTVVTRPAEERRFDAGAADEPLTAERREVADRPAVERTTEAETTRTT
jgi:hypothetical protein